MLPGSWWVDGLMGSHLGYTIRICKSARAAAFHSAQALLWQQGFSLERNECANVSQVGFIKLRPGTLVLTLDNYHVTKPGSREMLTYSSTADEQTQNAQNMEMETNVYIQTYFTCASTAEI